MSSVLETLVAEARERAHELSVGDMLNSTNISKSKGARRSLIHAIHDAQSANRYAVIAEAKKASPSKGILDESFDIVRLAGAYAQGKATAMSVVTEPRRFLGDVAWIRRAKVHFDGPVLRKDFIVDRVQVLESLAAEADAILLIARVLSTGELQQLTEAADECALEVLYEIHDEDDLAKALPMNPKIVGINCRDLKDFSVDNARAEHLRERIPDGILAVAESGIQSAGDVARLADAGFDAFLIGEALVTATDPLAKLRSLTGRVDG